MLAQYCEQVGRAGIVHTEADTTHTLLALGALPALYSAFLDEIAAFSPTTVGRAIGLGKRFTQRGLRRTFNDLARAAQVEGVVTKSISGHLTERMREALLDGRSHRAAGQHREGDRLRAGEAGHE